MSTMGFGWFGVSTFWLVPLVWRMVARALAGERRLTGPGTLRVWLGTLVVLCASASLEALTSLTDGGEAGEAVMTAGGSAGRALASVAVSAIGWTASLLMMLAVLALAAPMVFGETWRGLFARKPGGTRQAETEPADATPAPGYPAAAAPRDNETWETTTLHTGHGNAWNAPSARHKGVEAVSARRQPAWQPPPRTRPSPPQPGELWLHDGEAPGAVKSAMKSTAQAASAPAQASATSYTPHAPQARKPVPAQVPRQGQASAQSQAVRTAAAASAATATTHAASAQAAPRATVVSSPFHRPQPLPRPRSAITTLPEASAGTAGGVTAVAAATAATVATAATEALAQSEATAAAAAVEAAEDIALAAASETVAENADAAMGAATSTPEAVVAEAATPAQDEITLAESASTDASQPVTEAAQAIEAGEAPACATDPLETDAEQPAEVTLASIRQEALTLLAELQALARQPSASPVALADADEAGQGPADVVEPAAVQTLADDAAETTPVIEVDAQASIAEPVEVLVDVTGAIAIDAPPADPEAAALPEDADTAPPVEAVEIIAEAVAEPAEAAVDSIAADAPVAAEIQTATDDEAQPEPELAGDAARSEDTAAAFLDANALIQTPEAPAAPAPAAKPRIVLQAVVGRTVPLQAAQAAATPAPAPAPVAPPPPRVPVDYRLPGPDLLEPAPDKTESVSEERLQEAGAVIEQRLAEFKVPVSVVGASAGPVITRFEVDPAMGVRGSQVVGLMKDLARALGVTSIRVVETIPGKTCMGLELPNAKREMIRLSEIVGASSFRAHNSRLVLAMGKDITGNPVVTDLARAPHLLVAGTTGSGKSVAVNAMILSLLYKATPEDVRLIMIDPKMLELSVYEGIPHLLAPVVTDMKQAAHALNWCVGEMEKRYRLMSALGVRNLAGFNQKIRAAEAAGEKVPNPFSLTPDAPEPLSTLPLIVVVIDELADLMMVAGKKIEELIARLAQKARAAGIHLILATQRPSVDVITGLIKANIPTRVAFQVSSKIDSRTILDQMGAESLLGQGDMLFLPPGTGYPQRVHGAFVADDEVHRVVEHWKQFGEPDYEEAIVAGDPAEASGGDLFGDGGGGDAEADPLYDEAAAFVLNTRRASISAVQRHLRIGYNRSARLIEQMEVAGLVSPMGRNGTREVLAPGAAD